jgi:probable addiction module antidote protein
MLRRKIETYPWDVVDHLDSDEAIAHYLDAVLEEDDPVLLAAALGDVARAKGMTNVSRETGLGRESLYKALSSNGNPEFATVQKVIRSFGLKLHVTT